MGQHEENENSTSSEEKSDEKQKENNEKRERTISGGVKDEEIKFGEQLQDDLINSFCDKLQAVCPRKIEALLAIQFLMISDVAEMKKHVSGKVDAIQILYDRSRSHYVLVHFNPKYRHVALYDSLQPWEEDKTTPVIIQVISDQITHLFGHLYRGPIPVMIDKEFEGQTDTFSCGYRVIGALIDLARQKNPARSHYGRTALLTFFRTVLADPRPTWQQFETAKVSNSKEYNGTRRTRVWLDNPQWTETQKSSTKTSPSSRTSINFSEKRRSAGADDVVTPKNSPRSSSSSSTTTVTDHPHLDYFSNGFYSLLKVPMNNWKSLMARTHKTKLDGNGEKWNE